MKIKRFLAGIIATLGFFGCSSTEGPNIKTVAGTGIAGLSGDGAAATEADFYLPMDGTLGPDGKLYVLDWNNHRVRAIGTDGTVTTVAGTGQLGDGPAGPALTSDFNHPTNIVFDPQGRMVIAAWHNSRVKRVDLTTGVLEDICGTGGRAYNGDGGPASAAVLDLPAGLAYDSDGNLFIMDQANQIIRKVDSVGTITRVAGQCITGTCAIGEMPSACAGSNKLACLTSDPTGCSKPCAPTFGGDGGSALEARFAQPFGQAADPSGKIVFDADGNLYIADTSNHRIRKIDTLGIITTVAGTGTAGFAGDGGLATEAELNRPIDVDIGSDGTLYISDTLNSCVRSVGADGLIQTIVGVCGSRGFEGDGGSPTTALLDRPYGIELDEENNIYVIDTYNHRIRFVSR